MSIETFSPLPLTTFGTWLTLLDPSDVPPGMSPDCADMEFFPGGVRTRPGLVSQFAPLAGTPNVNALKTYITTNLVQRLLVLDSSGTIYKETSPGTLGVLIAGLQPNLHFASTTHFGREYMAFSDGLVGADLPRQFDDTFFDRVSQRDPAKAPHSPIPRSPEIFRRACTSASWCSSRARDFGPRPRPSPVGPRPARSKLP